jgi:hypothetical protein
MSGIWHEVEFVRFENEEWAWVKDTKTSKSWQVHASKLQPVEPRPQEPATSEPAEPADSEPTAPSG